MISAVMTAIKKNQRIRQIVMGHRISSLPAIRFAPPGHFYSPIPSLEEVRLNERSIFSMPREVEAIDLNEKGQLQLLNTFIEYYKDLPFQAKKVEGLRYYFDNENYSYSDAICLYCMIRHARPKQIIEVGSGYSSCVTLDTNELFFKGSIETTFVEPYPDLLLSLVKEEDKDALKITRSNLQNVDLGLFSTLQANDILFIDSTHVSKIGNDVNHTFFQILPVLNKGVFIHFHDIFYPFQYPKEWVYEGRAWSEAYLLRAFLQYNKSFEIVFFNTFMEEFHQDIFADKMPLCLKNKGGSIWLRKVMA